MVYPPSKTLYLPAIKEQVPTFEGAFRIRQDIQVNTGAEFWGSGREGWENFHDYGKARVSGLRQDNVLCADVSPCKMGTASVPAGPHLSAVDIRHK